MAKYRIKEERKRNGKVYYYAQCRRDWLSGWDDINEEGFIYHYSSPLGRIFNSKDEALEVVNKRKKMLYDSYISDYNHEVTTVKYTNIG